MTSTCTLRGCDQPAAAGIVRCVEHERRRNYHRAYAARKRAARLMARQQASPRCTFRLGVHVCRGALRTEVDRQLGRTLLVCDWCERRKAGVCRECPRPVYGTVGRALRCEAHAQAARRTAERRYADAHREELRERGRASYQTSEAERQRRIEYKRLWRKANPDKVKRQKRREALRQNPRLYEYHRKRREQERADRAARERDRYHGAVEPRACLTPGCNAPVSGRVKKCAACKAAATELARTVLASRGRAAA